MTNTISLEDFKKVDIAVGEILAVEKIPETDKLLKLTVNFGETAPRQIVSGIALHFPNYEILTGKKCMFVLNLEPRIIRGVESQGMILTVSDEVGNFSLLHPNNEIPVGTRAR